VTSIRSFQARGGSGGACTSVAVMPPGASARA
jgi:hypothetical protein